ncbi:MAG: helix-turn-helix domain-containing protein [Flavobacteriales bacterium]
MNRFPNIKALRLRNNFKQEYVADVLGMSQPEYSKVETGARKIELAVLKELCKLYDVELEVLMRTQSTLEDLALESLGMSSRFAQPVNQDVMERLMDNYSSLLQNYINQQKMQEKIIERLMPPER